MSPAALCRVNRVRLADSERVAPPPFHQQRQKSVLLLIALLATIGVGIIALSVLTLAIGLVSPVLTQLLIDDVLPQRVDGVLPLVAAGIGRLLALVAGRLDDRLMTSLFAHMMALPYRFFQEHSTGDLVQRFSSNAVIRGALTQQTVGGVQVLVFGVALLWINTVFGLWAIGLGVLEVVILVAPSRRIRQLTRNELEQVANTQSFTVEVASGAAYLKASGVEGGMLTSWARRLHDQLDASTRRQRFAALIAATSSTLASSAGAVLLVVGVSINRTALVARAYETGMLPQA